MKEMSVEQQKSVPAIVAEMQSAANRYRIVDSLMLGMFAERLDDAWKRDILVEAKRNQDVVDGLTDECDRLREALEGLVDFWEAHGGAFAVQVFPVRESAEAVEAARDVAMEKARAALSTRQDAASPKGGRLYPVAPGKGLKTALGGGLAGGESRPSWARELKHRRDPRRRIARQSRPSWARELKLAFRPFLRAPGSRAPRGRVN